MKAVCVDDEKLGMEYLVTLCEKIAMLGIAQELIIGSMQKNFDDHLAEVAGKMPNTTKKMSVAEVAKYVIYKNYKEDSRREGIDSAQINQLNERVTVENFNREVNDLVNNRIFKSVAERYQNKTWSKWNEIKSKTDVLHNEYQNFVNIKRGKNGLKFVTNIDLTSKKEVRDKYDKLGEVVAKQILSAPRNNQLVQGVAAGLIDYGDIQKACAEYFKSKNALDPKGFDPDEFMEKLDNGTFKDEAVAKIAEPIQKSAERNAKRHLAQQKATKQGKDMDLNNVNKLGGLSK